MGRNRTYGVGVSVLVGVVVVLPVDVGVGDPVDFGVAVGDPDTLGVPVGVAVTRAVGRGVVRAVGLGVTSGVAVGVGVDVTIGVGVTNIILIPLSSGTGEIIFEPARTVRTSNTRATSPSSMTTIPNNGLRCLSIRSHYMAKRTNC